MHTPNVNSGHQAQNAQRSDSPDPALVAALPPRPGTLLEITGFLLDTQKAKFGEDGVAVECDGSDHIIRIAVADNGSHIPIDSPMDQESARYGSLQMSPYRTTAKTSAQKPFLWLAQNEFVPAVILSVPLSREGNLGAPRFETGRFLAKTRLNFTQADDLLSSKGKSMLRASLGVLLRAAEAAFETRRREGIPVFLTTPGCLEKGALPKHGIASNITTELMILYSAAAGSLVRERGFPALFRKQTLDPALLAGAGIAPHELANRSDWGKYSLLLPPPSYTESPSDFLWLGVREYLPVTSPASHHAELINQRILLAAISGQESPPYDRTSVKSLAELCNAGMTEDQIHARATMQWESQRLSRWSPRDPIDVFQRCWTVAVNSGNVSPRMISELTRRLRSDPPSPAFVRRLLLKDSDVRSSTPELRRAVWEYLEQQPIRAAQVLDAFVQANSSIAHESVQISFKRGYLRKTTFTGLYQEKRLAISGIVAGRNAQNVRSTAALHALAQLSGALYEDPFARKVEEKNLYGSLAIAADLLSAYCSVKTGIQFSTSAAPQGKGSQFVSSATLDLPSSASPVRAQGYGTSKKIAEGAAAIALANEPRALNHNLFNLPPVLRELTTSLYFQVLAREREQ